MSDTNTELEAQQHKQQATIASHATELSQLTLSHDSAVAVLKKQLSDSVSDKNSMLKQSSKKEMELKRAKEELNNSATSIDTLRLVEQTKLQLEQEVERLRVDLGVQEGLVATQADAAGVSSGVVDGLRAVVKGLEGELEKSKTTTATATTDAATEDRVQVLQKELVNAQYKIRLQDTAASEADTQVRALQGRIDREIASNAQLSCDIQALERAATTVSKPSPTTNADTNPKTMDVDLHESEMAHLKANFESRLKLSERELQHSTQLHDMKDATLSKMQTDSLQLHGQLLEKSNGNSALMLEVNQLKMEVAQAQSQSQAQSVSQPYVSPATTDKCYSMLEMSTKVQEVELQCAEVCVYMYMRSVYM